MAIQLSPGERGIGGTGGQYGIGHKIMQPGAGYGYPAAGGAVQPASWRATGAGGGGGGGAGAGTADFTMPAYQPYQPGQYHDPNLDVLSGKGAQLLDPNSEYYQALLSRMTKDVGRTGAAAERASALRGAWGGFGAGASPEQMATAADIGRGTLEAQGEAAAGLVTAAPQLGASMLQSTFAPQQQEYGRTQADRQFGATMGEGARQFGVGVGLQEQGMAADQARFEAARQDQNQQWADEFNLRQDELAARYAGLPYGPF